MKTTRLIVSIALVALATTAFGQRSSLKERLFKKQKSEVEYISANYDSRQEGRIEGWMHDLKSWSESRNQGDASDAPLVCRTILCAQVEVVFDEEIVLERWMGSAFESGLAEEELFLESWMAVPFESGLSEEELCMEAWMAFPFEISAVDEELVLESWMTVPFETGDEIRMERWMTAAWI